MSLTKQFNDRSVSNHPITSWLWDFGDGNTSAEQNPEHTYSANGVYTVTLTITSGGVTAYVSHQVTAVEVIDLSSFWVVGKAGLSSLYGSSGSDYGLHYDGGWNTGGLSFLESGGYQPLDGASDPAFPSRKIVVTQGGIWEVNPYLETASRFKTYYETFSRLFYKSPPVAGVSNNELPRVYASPEYPGFFIISTGYAQIAYTTDSGLSWTSSFIFAGSDNYRDTLQLAISRSNTIEGTGRIYGYLNRQGQLYRSDDWAQTWDLIWYGDGEEIVGNYFQFTYPEGFILPESRDNGVPNTNTSDQVLYILIKSRTGDGHTVLYRSDDAGNSFQEVYDFGDSGLVPINMICHPTTSLLLYGMRADGKLMWSDDGGENWTTNSAEAAFAGVRLQVDPVDTDYLVMWNYKHQTNSSTYQKAYTLDRGESWTSINLSSNDDAAAFGMEIY